jgi:hypothetical protein
MVLGIMQPYFFPYPGYFSLIKATDKWISFDTPQFTQRSWMNRNRVLDPNSDSWKYINVPVKKHHLKTPLNTIEIQENLPWKEKIIGQLGYYRKYAPYYNEVTGFLTETLQPGFQKLSDLNIHVIKSVCKYLAMEFNYEIYSEMDVEVEEASCPDEWGLNFCKAMGVTEYINPEGGMHFVNRKKYEESNIKLKFLVYQHPPYDQKRREFMPSLSIIDMMMFNAPERINEMLEQFVLK